MDREAWRAAIHGVAKSRTRLSNWTELKWIIVWWTSRLLPCPGYHKQCCDEHWGTRVSFPSGFLSVYAQISLMESVGKGEGGEIWENGIETCIISCMKWVTSPGSRHDTGCLGLVHWDDPEGGYGEGGGFRMGNTYIPVADSFWYLAKLIQYCKV